MALFGRRMAANPHRPDPSGVFTAEHEAMGAAAKPRRGLFGGRMSLPEFIMLAGATAKDISSGGSDNFTGVMDWQQQRQAAAQDMAARQALAQRLGLGGGQPLNIQAAGPILAEAALMGVKGAGDIASIYDKATPRMEATNGVAWDPRSTPAGQRIGVNLQNVNGTMVDPNDQNMVGVQIPELEKGQMRVMGPNGPMAVNMDNYVNSLAEREGAVAGARARYNTVSGTDAQGRPVVTTAAQIAGSPLVGQSPADAARERTLAEATAKGQTDLTGALQTANNALGVIEQIRMHPGRKFGTGAFGVLPGIPGTPQRDFVALVDQAKGQVFLEAFESLKGGGQITQVEGQKATEAIARLDRAQTPEGFEKALNDLEQIIRSGIGRAQSRAGQGARPAASRGPGVTTQGQGFRILSVE